MTRVNAVIVEEGRHPAIGQITRWFDFDHLPLHLQPFSMPFAVLAQQLVDTLPDDPELVVSLRKLLEAKDASTRVAVHGFETGTLPGKQPAGA